MTKEERQSFNDAVKTMKGYDENQLNKLKAQDKFVEDGKALIDVKGTSRAQGKLDSGFAQLDRNKEKAQVGKDAAARYQARKDAEMEAEKNSEQLQKAINDKQKEIEDYEKKILEEEKKLAEEERKALNKKRSRKKRKR